MKTADAHKTNNLDVQREVDALNLGSKIRKLRKRHSLTLQDVSDLTGLSKSLLSQVENEVIAPPLATLIRIARALRVTIGYFFREATPTSRISVVRRDQPLAAKRRIEGRPDHVGYQYHALTHPMTPQHMEAFMVTFDPVPEAELTYLTHEGEEFIHVVEGKLEFRSAEKTIELVPGDSIYFDSGIAHALHSTGDGPARALAVLYAPESK